MTGVMIDTNVLVSAILNRNGTPSQAYKKAVEPPYRGLICEQTLEELRRVFNRKFPEKIPALEHFIATALPSVAVIPVPPTEYDCENDIRDIDDRPILRAVIKAGADILVTGDLDFLDSGITQPKIMTAAQFVKHRFFA